MRALKIILRTLSHILSVILCLVLTFAVMATMLVADVRVATNKDNIQKVLNQLLSAPPQYTLGPITGAATAGPELDLGALLSGEGNLSEMLVEYAFSMLEGSEVEIEKEAIQAFVEESTLKDFIADKSSSIISDLVTGENTTTISGEEIKQLLEENKDLIEEHFDVTISDEQIDQVAQMVEELPVVQEIQKNGVAGLLANGASPDGGDDAQGGPASSDPLAEIRNAIAIISSDTVLFACIGACAFVIALLFLLAWNKPYIAMLYSGSTICTTGLTFLIPTLVATYSPATWTELFSNIPESGIMIGSAARVVLMLTGSVCTTVTAIGAVLFVGGIVVFILMKKAKKAKAAAKETPVVEAAPAEEAPAVEAAPAAEEVPAVEAEPAAEEAPAAEAEPAAEEAPAAETADEAVPAEVTNA